MHTAFKRQNSVRLRLSAPQEDQSQDIWQNALLEEPESYKSPLVAMMHALDPQCFDTDYYRNHAFTEFKDMTDEQLWRHFCTFGQFEQRNTRCA